MYENRSLEPCSADSVNVPNISISLVFGGAGAVAGGVHGYALGAAAATAVATDAVATGGGVVGAVVGSVGTGLATGAVCHWLLDYVDNAVAKRRGGSVICGMFVAGASFEYAYTATVSAATTASAKASGLSIGNAVLLGEPVVGACAVATGALAACAAGAKAAGSVVGIPRY